MNSCIGTNSSSHPSGDGGVSLKMEILVLITIAIVVSFGVEILVLIMVNMAGPIQNRNPGSNHG